jgi:hypothetical protein
MCLFSFYIVSIALMASLKLRHTVCPIHTFKIAARFLHMGSMSAIAAISIFFSEEWLVGLDVTGFLLLEVH